MFERPNADFKPIRLRQETKIERRAEPPKIPPIRLHSGLTPTVVRLSAPPLPTRRRRMR